MDAAPNNNQNPEYPLYSLSVTDLKPDEDTIPFDTSCLGFFNPER
jgi:hypothetical protein